MTQSPHNRQLCKQKLTVQTEIGRLLPQDLTLSGRSLHLWEARSSRDASVPPPLLFHLFIASVDIFSSLKGIVCR